MKHKELHNGGDCEEEVVVQPGMFYWRGNTFSGLVCEKCNALYDNPDDSFMAAVTGRKSDE